MAIYWKFSDFNRETRQLRNNYIHSQKRIVKKEVEQVLAYMEWRRTSAEIPEKKLQKEVLEWISKIRFPNLGREDGILMARSYQGKLLMSVSTPELIGNDISKKTDQEGINTHKQFMEIVSNPEGGYAEYSWFNPVTKKIGRKITFVMGITEWQWYIGAGFWLDDINELIEQRKKDLKQGLIGYVTLIVLTMFILIILMFTAIRFISAKMEKSLAVFSVFFNTPATQSATINIEQIKFSELEELGEEVNRMIQETDVACEELQKAFEKRKELEQIINNSPAVAFLWRNEEAWPVKYVSESIRQFGYEAEEFTSGRLMYEQIVYKEDLQRLIDETNSYSRMNISNFVQEYRIVTKDGQVRWVNDRTWVRRDEQDRVTHYQGIIIDITEAKRSAETLNLLGDLLDKSINEIYLFNVKDFKFIHVNHGALQNMGYSLEEMRHLTPIDIKPDFTEETFKTMIAPLLKGVKKNIIFTTRHRRQDGSSYPTEVHLQLSEFESRQVFLAIILDITERQNAEASLRSSEEKFRKLFDNNPDAIAVISAEGRIADTNKTFHEMLGYDKNEIINLDAFALFPDPEDWNKITDEIAKKGFVTNWESRGLKKDGTQIASLVSATALRDENGNIREIQCIMKNITELQKLEQQLLHAQKMESVGRLAGGVAHDFNNMLSVILGRTELLMVGLEPESPISKGLTDIRGAAQRSIDLTRQLLTFARKQATVPVVLNLNETVEGMLKMLRRLIGEDINITWIPAPNLHKIMIDPSQIDQILANLCVNARDAISGVGTVTIETQNIFLDEKFCSLHPGSTKGGHVLLLVSDNGCGIDKETIPQIFEPFFTTKEIGQGTGLGLSTVYGIVKQNSGFINIYSEPGQGTTFMIYLPRHEGNEEPSQKAVPEERPVCGNETILLTEDEPELLNIAKMLLENLGYTVLPAASPAEAIHLAQNHPAYIHLLMTDVIMPQMNGPELAETIRAINSRIKILFMSGYTSDVITRHGVLNEGINFIQKPFTVNNLAAKLRTVLEKNDH